MRTLNIPLFFGISKTVPKLSQSASRPGALTHQWLELPMSRTNFHGPKDVRAIEDRLCMDICFTTVKVS